MIATERLLDVFVEVADTLVDDYDLIDFLHQFAANVVDVSGAAGVGLLLADAGDQLHHVASSSPEAEQLERFQLESAEGPCLDCFRTGTPVIVSDLAATAERWPRFVPQALERGFGAVHAFPLRLRTRTIGALNVFGGTPSPLEESDVRVVQALADVATIAILQERSIRAAETLAEQLQGALTSRIVIEQAKGVVARSTGSDVEQAFVQLRGHARAHGIRLTELAHAVVNRVVDPADLDPVHPPR